MTPRSPSPWAKSEKALQDFIASYRQTPLQTKEDRLMEMLAKAMLSMSRVTAVEGPKGKDGEKPVKGKDYFTKEEIAEFLAKVTPVKGKDYRDGKDGKTIKGEKGDPGMDAVFDIGEVKELSAETVKVHEQTFDHALIHDRKMLGGYELDEPTLQEGDLLQVKGKKLVGVKRTDDRQYVRSYVSQQGVSNIRHATVTASRELEPFIFWIVDATAGDITLTIPSAAGRENAWLEIMRIDGTANTVTVLPTGSETFSGMSSYVLQQWTDFQIFAYNGSYLLRHAS